MASSGGNAGNGAFNYPGYNNPYDNFSEYNIDQLLNELNPLPFASNQQAPGSSLNPGASAYNYPSPPTNAPNLQAPASQFLQADEGAEAGLALRWQHAQEIPQNISSRRSGGGSSRSIPTDRAPHEPTWCPPRVIKQRSKSANKRRKSAQESKAFECENCGKCFGTSNDQKRHYHETHHISYNGIPPPKYLCRHQGCERHTKPFYRRSNLTDHIIKKHPEGDIPPDLMGQDIQLPLPPTPVNDLEGESLEQAERRLHDLEEREKALTGEYRNLGSEARVVRQEISRLRRQKGRAIR